MRLLSGVLLLAYGTGLSVAATCNADNCARAVTGTVTGSAAQASHKADCSSFFRVTVTPAASTSTVTITPFTNTLTGSIETDFSTVTASVETDVTVVTAIISSAPVKRQATVMPSLVPAYASACSGTSRYSSACSCFGVTKTTITAATPVTTKTVTATATIYITATTVQTVPVTATTLITSTTSITACGGVVSGGGSCGCSYNEQCNTQFVDNGDGEISSVAASLSDCIQRCDNNFDCSAFVYQKSTGNCGQLRGGYNAVPNVDYVSGAIASGTCGGICSQDYKRDLGALAGAGVAEKARGMREREPEPVGGKKFVGTAGGS